MTITLEPADQRLLDELVSAGDYPTPETAIHEALRLLRDHSELRRKIQQAVASVERGEGTLVTTPEEHERFIAGIKAEGAERLKSRQVG